MFTDANTEGKYLRTLSIIAYRINNLGAQTDGLRGRALPPNRPSKGSFQLYYIIQLFFNM